MRGPRLHIPGTPGRNKSLGFVCGGRREVSQHRSSSCIALSAHLYNRWLRQPPALWAPPPLLRTPQNVSLPPRAEAKRLLQINFFLKVNGQHILAKRNSAFWRAPAMYTDNQRIIS